MKMYELTTEFSSLLEQDELTDEMMQRIDDLSMSIEDKAGKICKVRQHLSGDVDMLDNEIKRLQSLKKSRQNAKQRLEDYVINCMESANIDKIDAGTFKLTLAKKPASVLIEEESKLPGKFTVMEIRPDKQAIKQAIKDGEEVPGATMQSSGVSLRVR